MTVNRWEWTFGQIFTRKMSEIRCRNPKENIGAEDLYPKMSTKMAYSWREFFRGSYVNINLPIISRNTSSFLFQK